MNLWFFLLGVPLVLAGLAAVCATRQAASFLTAFPRMTRMGYVLCAIGWLFTAYEVHTIGIAFFDRLTRRLWFLSSDIPGAIWIWAIVLTVLTCLWMPNLLPIRGLAALLMLYPAELFPVIRLEPTVWRLALVVVAYLSAIFGMFAMFYPWRIRQLFAYVAAHPPLVRGAGGLFLMTGLLFLVLGVAL